MLLPATAAKLDRLKSILAAHTPLLIAYSGGVDSACLLAVAHSLLGSQTLAVIADSPSLPRQALADALALAEKIGAPCEVIPTEELNDPRYTANPVNRCYFCKAELFAKLDTLARERRFAAIAYGENADDMLQPRPGRQAAQEFHIIAPLRDAALTKQEIREISRLLDLPTADAPAQPCLSSRIPHGAPVTPHALSMVERGEALVRALGFKVFRVRHLALDHQTRARLQVAPDEMPRIKPLNDSLISALLSVGYDHVEIDPAGYRSPSG